MERFGRLAKLAELAELAEVADDHEKAESERPNRRKWVRDWIARRGEEIPLFKEIKGEDVDKFYADFRFMPTDFEVLLNRY